MKLAIVSDLHLEFCDLILKNEHNADVLIIAGDVCHNNRFAFDFFKRCSFQFPKVFYIAGNHEFYHGRHDETIKGLRKKCKNFENVYFFDNDCLVLNDIVFMGATLWTDCNKEDTLTMYHLTRCMADFFVIKNDMVDMRRVTPADTVKWHEKTLEYFKCVLDQNKDRKVVIFTHHSPSFQSMAEIYVNDTLLNGGFHSGLEDFILDHEQIKLWIHGHTHFPFDYHIGKTRIICNPRGYVGPERSINDVYNPVIVEI